MNASKFTNPNGELIPIEYEGIKTYAFAPSPLPPKIEWDEEILAAESLAQSSLSKLNGLLSTIPASEVLLSTVLRKEAVLSSHIEGTQATFEDLALFEITAIERTPDVKEVINYVNAMKIGENILKKLPLCLRVVREIHKFLLEDVRGKNKAPGEFRKGQVFIASPGSSVENASYIPPSADKILPLLDNWEKFIHRENYPPLIQSAILHYQFEAIHPFLDGNGRVGRLLINLFFADKNILNPAILHISEYFANYREEYYSLLLAVSQRSQWKEWLLFFLKGITEQSNKTSNIAIGIRKLYENYLSRFSGITQDIAVMFLSKPFLTANEIMKNLNVSKQSVYNSLKNLAQENIITSIQIDKKKKIFKAEQILDTISK